jgi:biotin carboxyl carrier protein
MPGIVTEVLVAVGDRVVRGQEVVILESMKMETPVMSASDGVVTGIKVKVGDSVGAGAVLVEIAPA